MAAAIFGLVGVVIGGLLQGGWTWVIERRREGWAARRAARLFAPALHRCHLAMDRALSHATTWGELTTVIEANVHDWPEHADVFAGTLVWEQWFDIYAAVRALQQLTWYAADFPENALIRPGTDDERYLRDLIDQAMEGALTLAHVGIAGVGRHRLRRRMRRLWYRLRRSDDDELIEEVLAGAPDPPNAIL